MPRRPHVSVLPWHREPGVLAQYVSDLITGEISLLRPGAPALSAHDWRAELRLDEEGLGLDSLERLSVASALTSSLHLAQSGLEDLLLVGRTFQAWTDVAHRALEHYNSQLTFYTSGSSGKPKPCVHSLETLWQEVFFLARLLEGTRRILFAVPTHHIYGFLFAILLPAHLQIPRLDIRQMTPQGVQHRLRDGDLLVSHPAHWELFRRHAVTFPAGVKGVTSTAPCAPSLVLSLLESGLQQLLQVYGSSETAGIGWRFDPGQPYSLMPFWAPHPSDPSSLHRTDPDGSLHVVMPPDYLRWEGDRQFTPAGRIDEAVQVAGVNVFPARIQQKLREHPQVAAAAVRLMRPDEGERLKAFVVPRPGNDSRYLTAELLRWAGTQMTAPEIPKSFTFGTQLPLTSEGKLADWNITQSG